MDVVRFGRQIRALRRRRGWRQVDLAIAAHTSRSTISRVELGQIEDLGLRTVDAVTRALSARLDLLLSWNGEALDRLLDADHAALVELVAAELRSLGWEVAVEVTFNIRGERGSIDVLAFHPQARVILVVEVKSVVPDLQATLVTFDRKTRLAPVIARERGWMGRSVGRVLVIRDDRTARRRVAAHGSVFAAALPDRAVAIRRWLRSPDAGHAISGLRFLPHPRPASWASGRDGAWKRRERRPLAPARNEGRRPRPP